MRGPIARLKRLGLSPGFYAAVAGWAAVLLIALFSNAFSPRQIELSLQDKAERALAAGGFGFASVEMDGQIAELTGFAASAEEVRAARLAVLRAAGPGGPWAGGVTAVREREFRALAPAASPFLWVAQRTPTGVRIAGVAPSTRARQRIEAKARALFPGAQVEDQSMAASGAPAGPPWTDAALLALEQLARLSSGDVRVIDAAVVVSGEASAANADAIRGALRERLSPPYAAEVDVLSPGQDLGAPALQGLTLSGAAVGDCQDAFDRLLREEVITFEPDSAALDPSGFPLLNTLARIARRCDQYSIEIAGHTSSEGERNLNLALSRDRAQAVVDHLARLGVRKDRLVAEGYGDERPAQSNQTPAGRAANRRIEFAVRR